MNRSKSEKESLKIHAKEIFMTSDLTLKELAEIIGVSEKTIGNWAVGWADEKKLLRASKQTALRNLYKRLLEQTGDSNTSSDEIKKTTSSIKDLEDSRTTIPDKIDLYTDFIKFLREQKGVEPEFFKKVNQFQNLHIQTLVKTYVGSER